MENNAESKTLVNLITDSCRTHPKSQRRSTPKSMPPTNTLFENGRKRYFKFLFLTVFKTRFSKLNSIG